MRILYIITIIAIYTLIMLIHKTNKKQNILAHIAITGTLILILNIFECLIYTFFGIACTLANLSIFNIILVILLSVPILKTKKVQKYYLKIPDLIFSCLLIILIVLIAYKQYGYPFHIKYEITDGSTHYFFAQQFYENKQLLFEGKSTDLLGLYNSSFRLPGAYVNEGILFMLIDGIMLKTDAFILFDLLVLYLSGILFYFLLKTYTQDKRILQLLAAIFTLIYVLGYQLNSMLYGYVYLSLAMVLIIDFLLLISNIKKQEISEKIYFPVLSLVSFGIFFSYAYFIPIIYISIIIYLIIKTKFEKNKISNTQNIISLIYLIIIPTIIGAAYFILFPLVNGSKTEISTLNVDGKIYENFITNYLIFIPIIIVYLILCIKNKYKNQNNYGFILFAVSILFVAILFIGYKLEIVSRYYFFKAYYEIWIITIYVSFIMLTYILNKSNKKIQIGTYIYISVYICAVLIATTLNKNIGINDIFYDNFKSITCDIYLMQNEEISIIDNIEHYNVNLDDMYILPGQERGRMFWMSVLYHNQSIYINYVTEYYFDIEKWLNENNQKYYLAYQRDYKKIEDALYLDANSNDYKVIYNDEYIFILERQSI